MLNANAKKEITRARRIIALFSAIIIFSTGSIIAVGDTKVSADEDYMGATDQTGTPIEVVSITQKLEEEKVTPKKLEEETVTTQKHEEETATTQKLEEKTVTTQKLEEKTVTTQKLEEETVTPQKLEEKTVTTQKLEEEKATTQKVDENPENVSNIEKDSQTAKQPNAVSPKPTSYSSKVLTEENSDAKKKEEKTHIGKKYQLTNSEYKYLCKLTLAESTSMDELIMFAKENPEDELSEEELEELREYQHKERVSIAAVTLRRTYEEKEFPDNLIDVIFQKDQYSTAYKDGEIYMYKKANIAESVEDLDITKEIRDAVDEALDGIDPTEEYVTGGAIYFYSDRWITKEEREKRKNIKQKVKFADTVFYRELN